MTSLTNELERYLEIRRSLGFTLSTSARVLRRFVAFADAQDINHISTDLFLRWKEEFGGAVPAPGPHASEWSASLLNVWAALILDTKYPRRRLFQAGIAVLARIFTAMRKSCGSSKGLNGFNPSMESGR